MTKDSDKTGAVDKEAIEAFLATAPAELSSWADEQRAALNAEGQKGAAPRVKGPEQKPSVAKNINKVLVALLAAAIVLLVKQWGMPPAEQSASQNPSAAPHGDMSGMSSGITQFKELDQKKVEELQAKIKADDKDNASRRTLAKMYSEAGLWDQSGALYEEILKREPNDLDSLLAFGVIQFNFGNMNGAIETWTKAAEVAPDRPEAQFNLGFAYLAKEPSDKESAKKAWQKVVDMDPDSDLAKTAKNHIDGLDGES